MSGVMGHMAGVSIGPTDKEVTVNAMFDQMGPRLHAPVRGRMTRVRHPDGLADSLRYASALLWQIANSIGTHYGKPVSRRSVHRRKAIGMALLWQIAKSIGAHYGKPVSRRSARRTMATGMALSGGMLAGMGMMYLMDRVADRRHRALLRDKMTHYRRGAGGPPLGQGGDDIPP